MTSRYKYTKVNGKSRSQHRVIKEQKLGRKLKTTEYVHHKNNISKDNRPENLRVMSRYKHMTMHSPEGERKTVICKVCKHKFVVIQSYYDWRKMRGDPILFCSKSCAAKYRNIH